MIIDGWRLLLMLVVGRLPECIDKRRSKEERRPGLMMVNGKG